MAAEDHSDSAMIALVPRDEDAQRLAVDGYEPSQTLHVTLVFLGDATEVADPQPLEAGLRRLAAQMPPIEANTWAVSNFNPHEKPCACYLIGQGKDQEGGNGGKLLESLQQNAHSLALNEMPNLREQHSPWVAHLAVGYDLDLNALTEAGQPVVFDRLRLAVGDTDIDIPLEGATMEKNGLLAANLEERLDILEAVVAAPGIVQKAARAFSELLHPRGKDGRFIEKNGFVQGDVTVSGGNSKGSKVSVDRAQVTDILPNPSNADDPIIEVSLPEGGKGRALASTVSTVAPPKARLDSDAPAQPMDGEQQSTLDLGDVVITPDEIQAIYDQPGDATEVADVEEAVRLLAQGKKVRLQSRGEVAVMLDRMREIVANAKEHGMSPWTVSDDVADGQMVSHKGKAGWTVSARTPGSDTVTIRNGAGEEVEALVSDLGPVYDLCNVTVKGSSLFCVESKGINRIQMPQLKGIPLPGSRAASMEADSRGEVDLSADFRKMLEDRGITVTDGRVPAVNLKASQNELDGVKTAQIAAAIEGGTYDEEALFISNDNYIVDGHHRWSAMIGVDSRGSTEAPLEMPVAQVDMDILELLAESNRFALEWGIPQASMTDTAESQKAKMDAPQSQTELLERMPG